MKLLELQIDDSIFEKVKGFLEILPEDKIKLIEIFDDSHIPYATDEEQKDIEQKLKSKGCHVVSHSKVTKI